MLVLLDIKVIPTGSMNVYMLVKKPVDFTESKPETSIWDSPVSQKSLLMNYSKEKTTVERLNLSDKTSRFTGRVRVTRML